MEPPVVGWSPSKNETSSMGYHAEGLAHRWIPTARPSAFAPRLLILPSGVTPLQFEDHFTTWRLVKYNSDRNGPQKKDM